MAALERVRANTVETRLPNEHGLPSFDLRFFVLDKAGESAGVALYGAAETHVAVCTENGAEEIPFEGLIEGAPRGRAPAVRAVGAALEDCYASASRSRSMSSMSL